MSRNYGNATLKNHITKAAPGTLAAMGEMFGISQTDFLAAIYGDPGAIQKIADMGRLSQVARDNLEKALDATKLTIETTGDINKALAELVKQTQRSGTQTMAAIYDATLAEKKMGNELTEMSHRQGYSVAAETARHLRTSQLIQIQGTTAELMAVAKYQTDLIKEQNKPVDAQDTADRAYDKAVNNLLWQQGSEANLSRIPKPDYVGSNARGLGKLWKGFRNAMGI
jgi:hypothetical protein